MIRSQVQHIVITSSCAAVANLRLMSLSKPNVFSEHDWGESSVKEVQEIGNKAPPMTIYHASKTLAEKGGPFEYPVFRWPSYIYLVIRCLGVS